MCVCGGAVCEQEKVSTRVRARRERKRGRREGERKKLRVCVLETGIVGNS